MCFGVRAPVIVVLTMFSVGFVENSAQSNQTELRPEYIHPEGAAEFEPYLREYDAIDMKEDEEEDDYHTEEHSPENSEPVFLKEPKNGYIIRNKAATLTCSVANVLQVSFKCNGAKQEGHQLEHVDPQHGIRVVESEVNVTREDVAGVKRYSCECVAWNGKGSVRSRPVVVEIAFMKKQFTVHPLSSAVELGRSITFRCQPPLSNPTAFISWLKNGVPLENTIGDLVLSEVTLRDVGNYSCVAENIAGRRQTEPAVLTVYVNGGWSEWGPWEPCPCGDQVFGQQRSRSCTRPAPVNGGSTCKGPAVQQSRECSECFNEGVWSQWGEWSACSAECVRTRRRRCSAECRGSTEQHAVCAGALCPTGRKITPILVGVASIIVLLTASFVLLYIWCRNKNRRPGYVMTRTGLKQSSSRPSAQAPDLTRSCNEYLVSSSDHSYDLPHIGSSHTSTFGSKGKAANASIVSRNHYEIQPPSVDSCSNGTCGRTFASRSSGSTSPFVELLPSPTSSKLDVAVSFPASVQCGYKDKI